jgi:multiple sugar transport system ATP-binding protein
VALARAIVRQPTVFLMDEPLSNLDAKLRVSTRAQIKHLQHELAVTTVYVTHDQIEAMTLADRVVVMNRGVIQQVGTPTEIYDRPANAFVAGFIGSPAMNLIDGAVEGGAFVADGLRVEGFGARHRGPAVLGFRAEDAVVDPASTQLRAPIYAVELLGDATMVTFRLGGTMISVRADKSYRAAIGDVAGLRIDPANCHLYRRDNGLRIPPAPGEVS